MLILCLFCSLFSLCCPVSSISLFRLNSFFLSLYSILHSMSRFLSFLFFFSSISSSVSQFHSSLVLFSIFYFFTIQLCLVNSSTGLTVFSLSVLFFQLFPLLVHPPLSFYLLLYFPLSNFPPMLFTNACIHLPFYITLSCLSNRLFCHFSHPLPHFSLSVSLKHSSMFFPALYIFFFPSTPLFLCHSI